MPDNFAPLFVHHNMKYMFLIVCCLCAQSLSAQFPRFPLAEGISGVFSAFTHPALMADLKHPAAGIYTERRFMLRELSVFALGAGIPFSKGVLGVKYWQTGYRVFREQLIGLGYSLPLGDRLRAAVYLDHQSARAQGFSRRAMIGEAGVSWRLTGRFGVRVHIFNPAGSGNGRPPLCYSAGLHYSLSPQFLVDAVWVKEEGKPVSIQVSGLYRPLKDCWLQGGFASQPVCQFAGLGFRTGDIRIGVSGSYHLNLGITPGIAVVWGRE